MKKIILLTFTILLFALSANAQNCDTLEDCNTKLSRASQQIEKLLDVGDAKTAQISALKTENESRRQKELLDKAIIENQEKLIKILEKQTGRKVCILTCGFIKIRY